MSHVTLALVMGLPGAGKTELCKQAPDHLTSWRIEHVAFDCEIDDAVFGDPVATWKMERSRVIQKVRSRVLDVRHSSGPPCLLLLDDNFYYRSMRQAFVQLAKDEGCSLVIVHVDTPLDVCLQRDAQRAVPVGEEVIRKMSARFEHLDVERIWWERLSVVFRQSVDWSSVRSTIEQSQNLPLSREAEESALAAAEESRRTCNSNFRHQADLKLRHIFKSRLHASGDLSTEEGRQTLARLQVARAQVLAALRSGDLLPPADLDLSSSEGQDRLNQLLCFAFDQALAS